jgi:PT repeat
VWGGSRVTGREGEGEHKDEGVHGDEDEGNGGLDATTVRPHYFNLEEDGERERERERDSVTDVAESLSKTRSRSLLSSPTTDPIAAPTVHPTSWPTGQPTSRPSSQPTSQPTGQPTSRPSSQPTSRPTGQPTSRPSSQPTGQPTSRPSSQPTSRPTGQPISHPSAQPSSHPTSRPSTQVRILRSIVNEPTKVTFSSSPHIVYDLQHICNPQANTAFSSQYVLSIFLPSATPLSLAFFGYARSTPIHSFCLILSHLFTHTHFPQPSSRPTGQPSGQPTSMPTHTRYCSSSLPSPFLCPILSPLLFLLPSPLSSLTARTALLVFFISFPSTKCSQKSFYST